MTDQAPPTEPIPASLPPRYDLFSLARAYWGLAFTQIVVILMTLGAFFFTVTLGVFQIGLITTFGFPHPVGPIVANTLEIAFCLGWLVALAPPVEAGSAARHRTTRLLIRICLVILIAAAVFAYLPIFGQLRPGLRTIDAGLQLLTIVPSLVLYPLQMRYAAHIADMLGDTKLRTSAHAWSWIAPVSLIISLLLVYAAHGMFFWLLMLVVLIIVIQYWNTINRLRKGLKRLIQATSRGEPHVVKAGPA